MNAPHAIDDLCESLEHPGVRHDAVVPYGSRAHRGAQTDTHVGHVALVGLVIRRYSSTCAFATSIADEPDRATPSASPTNSHLSMISTIPATPLSSGASQPPPSQRIRSARAPRSKAAAGAPASHASDNVRP